MRRKRCILICLMMTLLLSSCGENIKKVDTEDQSVDFIYTIDNSGGVVITGYSGTDSELKVPSSINGHPVKSIGDLAFYFSKNLTSITLPEGLESIGNWAFSACDNLTSITLPDGLESIGFSAFSYCNSLTSIPLPEGLKSIDDNAFFSCGDLATVTLPDSIEIMGSNPFVACERLKGIWVEPDHPVFTQIDGILFNKAEKKLIFYPMEKSSESYLVPAGVKSIGKYAFSACKNLTSIILPEGLESIGEGAFIACENLTSITLPEGVKSIGNSTFSSCENLTSITLPEGLKSIGEDAFFFCKNLTAITLPASLTSIDTSAFDSDIILIVPRDSYAEKWGKENGFAYRYPDSADY